MQTNLYLCIDIATERRRKSQAEKLNHTVRLSGSECKAHGEGCGHCHGGWSASTARYSDSLVLSRSLFPAMSLSTVIVILTICCYAFVTDIQSGSSLGQCADDVIIISCTGSRSVVRLLLSTIHNANVLLLYSLTILQVI